MVSMLVHEVESLNPAMKLVSFCSRDSLFTQIVTDSNIIALPVPAQDHSFSSCWNTGSHEIPVTEILFKKASNLFTLYNALQ